MIVDPKNPRKGIIEMRPIDAAKIKKIAKVEKSTDPKTGAKKIKGVKEVYVYSEKPDQSNALKLHQRRFATIHLGYLIHQEPERFLIYKKQSNL